MEAFLDYRMSAFHTGGAGEPEGADIRVCGDINDRGAAAHYGIEGLAFAVAHYQRAIFDEAFDAIEDFVFGDYLEGVGRGAVDYAKLTTDADGFIGFRDFGYEGGVFLLG